jgi:adhesin/invasin
VNTAFATALQATVRDTGSNPLSGVTVTFTAPSSGASASFSGLTTATAVTDSSGIATAPALTANGTIGSYTVTAAVSGIPTPASFSLSNTAAANTSLSGSVNTSMAGASLTAEGPADWIHWGDASLNRRAGGGSQISTYTVVGADRQASITKMIGR